MSKKLKIFAIVVLCISALIFVVSKMGGGDTAPTSALSSSADVPPSTSSSDTQTANEFSTILSSINRITIDTALFKNNAYTLLRDYPLTLGSDTVGRNNPFAPIGYDTGSQQPQNTLIQTIQPGKITATSAEFAAQVTLSDTVPTALVFEYGTTDVLGNFTPPMSVIKNGVILTTVSGLVPNTTYYVRATASRGSATVPANITSFTTSR